MKRQKKRLWPIGGATFLSALLLYKLYTTGSERQDPPASVLGRLQAGLADMLANFRAYIEGLRETPVNDPTPEELQNALGPAMEMEVINVLIAMDDLLLRRDWHPRYGWRIELRPGVKEWFKKMQETGCVVTLWGDEASTTAVDVVNKMSLDFGCVPTGLACRRALRADGPCVPCCAAARPRLIVCTPVSRPGSGARGRCGLRRERAHSSRGRCCVAAGNGHRLPSFASASLYLTLTPSSRRLRCSFPLAITPLHLGSEHCFSHKVPADDPDVLARKAAHAKAGGAAPAEELGLISRAADALERLFGGPAGGKGRTVTVKDKNIQYFNRPARSILLVDTDPRQARNNPDNAFIVKCVSCTAQALALRGAAQSMDAVAVVC